MKLYFGGVLFSVVYNMAAGILNAAGNSRRSVIYLACASITNIILDLVLIAGLKMGVAGAAIATDISQLVSCVLSLRFLMKVDADYKVELSAIRPDQRMTSRIIRIGLPTGIQTGSGKSIVLLEAAASEGWTPADSPAFPMRCSAF